MGDPVGMVFKRDCEGFLKYFARQSEEHLLSYRTANGDSAIHIAAAMENPQLIKKFLEWLTPEIGLGVLKQADAFGNTGLHEAAAVKDFDVARVLVDFSRKSGDAYGDLLVTKNCLGETPVYRAAALGKIKVLQILTEPDGDLRYHFRRKDDKTILHMAILGQHFETAIWLLNRDSSLADKRTKPPTSDEFPKSRKPPKSDEHIGFTCLELLALMPTAFTGADDMKKKASLFNPRTWMYYLAPVILSCLRTYPDDDCNYKEDLETDKIDNRKGHAKKRRGILFRMMSIGFWRRAIPGSGIIRETWNKMKTREDALALVKMLVKPEKKHERREQETSTNPTTISLGFGKGDDLVGKKLVDFWAKDLDEALKIKDHPEKEIDRNAPATDRTLLFAASNGIRDILGEILRQNPQAMLSTVNQKGQTILHVAIRRRQHNIFQFIMEKMPLYVLKWATRIDNKGYTILHHVADMKHYEHGIRPGPVYQFQEELQWFECVKDIAPSHYAMHRDAKKRMTAKDLFDRTHEDQLKKAQDWIT